ncbi:MAG: hypothetical protein NTY74_11190 [Ignavibacteriae bacterium]|nr:hypothetical protein [Ignavibacteriota bacterium]
MTAGNLYILNFRELIIRKLVLNIILIISIVFVLDFAIGHILRHYYFRESRGYHYRTTYSMEKTNAEILIFGSSRANHHYISGLLEDSLKMTAYNTGREMSGIFYQTAILKSVLKRYTPKLIVLDFAGEEGKAEQYDYLSSLLPYYKTHEEIRNIIELKSQFERIKLVSEIYPFNSEIRTIIYGNLENKEPINAEDKNNKGYIALYGEVKAKIADVDNSTSLKVDTNKFNSFREFIQLAKSSGAIVIVSYSPIFQKYNRLQDLEICKGICSSENITFWDFSKDTTFINKIDLFYDIGHLNHNGAILFSNIVATKIKHEIFKKDKDAI